MSLMSSKEHAESDIELQNMLKEIQQSLSTHLTNILTPIFNEKKDIHNILLNVPMIKKMHIENVELKSTNKLLTDEIHKLKQELSKYQNIRLQVKELNNPEEKSLNIELDVDDKNKKMERQYSGIKLASLSNIDYFNNMISDEEQDTDDEKYEAKTVPNSDMWLSSLNREENNNDENDMFLGSDDKGKPWRQKATVTKENEDDEEDEVVDSDEEIVAEDEEEDEDDKEEVEKEVEEEDEDNDEDDDEDDEEEVEKEDNEEEVEEEDDDNDEDDEEDEEEDEEEVEEEDDDNDEDDEEDMEVEDVEIDGNLYVTTGTENGVIYKVDSDGEILEDDDGEFVKAGYYKDGVSFLSKD